MAFVRLVTSPIRLMERVGEFVADRIVGSPEPSAEPAKEEVADLTARLATVADDTAVEEPAVKAARPQRSPAPPPSGALAASGVQKRRSPTVVVKAESSRNLPSRRARPKAGRGFYSETNLTALACVARHAPRSARIQPRTMLRRWTGVGTQKDPIVV